MRQTIYGEALHSRMTDLFKLQDPKILAMHNLFRLCRIHRATMYVQDKTVRVHYRDIVATASTLEEIERLQYIFV
jgi:hypothetical protein